MDLKIYIATHKKFEPPKEDYFIPIQVGKEVNKDLGYIGDNTGIHISKKNENYCELTALYWMWKNESSDYLGLCHYRRYFDIENKTDQINDIRYISFKEFKKQKFSKDRVAYYLNKYDVILAKPKIYEYSMEFVYGYSHSVIDYQILTQVLKELYPNYINSWNKISHRNNKLIHYNMFISSRRIMDEYCKWLFEILFEVEKRVKIPVYDYDKRIFGFMSERLMHLYFLHNTFKIKYLPILYIKDENFRYNTPSKRIKILSNMYKNFLFFLLKLFRKKSYEM